MKYAGAVVGFVGSWVLLTMFIGGVHSADEHGLYVTSLIATAPFTALAVGGVALIAVGCWLHERASKRG